MRFKALVFAALLSSICAGAYAELQNVEVGGGIRIRGNWYDYDKGVAGLAPRKSAWVEQRTRLNFKADFTDNVSAFVELDSYGDWGTAFRSDYLTGFDTAGGASIDLYQAYIEANEMWGTPLRLRVGRQELVFGSQWLVGVNDTSSLFRGLSFDAVRLDYTTDQFTIAAWASKLAESFGNLWSRGDVDFYGVYGSYTGIEDVKIDAYYMFLRDQQGRNANTETFIHTLGLRGNGKVGAFDFEAEVAYQFGDVNRPGRKDPNYADFGANVEVGYTFDASIQPRIFLGGAYLGGGDHNKVGGDRSFNRLFSNWEYSEFLENTDLSNVWLVRAGGSIAPTEQVKLTLAATYFHTVDTINSPWWDLDNDRGTKGTLGWELGLYGNYQYTEDLAFRAGVVHFFGDKGLNGNFINGNGLVPYLDNKRGGGDYNYLFVETEIKF